MLNHHVLCPWKELYECSWKGPLSRLEVCWQYNFRAVNPFSWNVGFNFFLILKICYPQKKISNDSFGICKWQYWYWNYGEIKCVHKQRWSKNELWSHLGVDLFCIPWEVKEWRSVSVERHQSSVAGVQAHNNYYCKCTSYSIDEFQNWCLARGWH